MKTFTLIVKEISRLGRSTAEVIAFAVYALPYFLLIVFALILLYAFPGLVTWLPEHMIG